MFITLEGIEGSGKSSLVPFLVDFLENNGHTCLLTREPGGTVIGEKIRAILLDPDNRDMAAATELLLYMADRAQHVFTLILPALASGKTVICDRYLDATLVYQGYARGLDTGLIEQLHQQVMNGVKPDLTFLLDLPPETGLRRAWRQLDTGQRPDRESRFEKETLNFHEKVRSGYLDLARREPHRFRVIDADQPQRRVCDDVLEALGREVARKGPAPVTAQQPKKGTED